MKTTVCVTSDLAAVQDNLAVVRELCPRSRIMAMVKGDAYGHGLLSVARALKSADGFGVARLSEALALRRAGIRNRILLLGTHLDASALAICSEQNIDVTVHDELSLGCVGKQARQTPLRVWLEVDTGMHRLGLSPDQFLAADRVLGAHPGVRELVHMTHFSNADEVGTRITERQLSCFLSCHERGAKVASSVANSAALITRPETRMDWVRPGIVLYGDNPVRAQHHLPFKAAMMLRARILAIRNIPAGEAVGYNARWVSARPSRIGTIGIGYGDGYPRHARNGTPVWIEGQLVPLVGQVSMDCLTVDLTDHRNVAVGDEAELWGRELAVSAVAKHADTISYALLTSITHRVSRTYIGREN